MIYNHLKIRGQNIMELTMIKSAIPSLFTVLKGNKFDCILSGSYNPRLPDGDGEASEALSPFKDRINRDINRVRSELPKVYRLAPATRMRDLVRFLESN